MWRKNSNKKNLRWADCHCWNPCIFPFSSVVQKGELIEKGIRRVTFIIPQQSTLPKFFTFRSAANVSHAWNDLKQVLKVFHCLWVSLSRSRLLSLIFWQFDQDCSALFRSAKEEIKPEEIAQQVITILNNVLFSLLLSRFPTDQS